MTIRTLTAMTAAALISLLGACSPSSPDASAPTTTQESTAKPTSGDNGNTKADSKVNNAESEAAACDLLTDEEVSAAIGSDVVSREAPYPSMCTWKFANSESGHIQNLTLSIGSKKKFEIRTSRDNESFDAVEGVGDDAAFFLSGPSGWATENHVTAGKAVLLVLVGDSTLEFSLRLHELERADASKALSALATKAIGRL